jgi:hypothetical protein
LRESTAYVEYTIGVSFVRRVAKGVLKYDPFLRDFVTNTDGTTPEVHPVDQKVAILLMSELKPIGRLTPNTLQTAIDNVRVCLKEPLDSGDIELLDVQITQAQTPTSRVFLGVSYRNLRLETPAVQEVTIG